MDPTTGAVLAVGLIAFLAFIAFIAYLVTLNKECCNMPGSAELQAAIAGVSTQVGAVGAALTQVQTDVSELLTRIEDQISPADIATLTAIGTALGTSATDLLALGATIDAIAAEPVPPPVP